MPSRAGTQSAAISDNDMEQANAASTTTTTATSDARKRKAPASRASSAKKAASSTKRRGSKAGNNGASGATAEDGASSLQAERDDSLDVDEDDDDDDEEDGSKSNAYGRLKPAQTNRKAQNRNAQRESRQRKAEYVKALEGYVALHKIDLSSQLQGLLFAIGLLIDENMKLRATLGSLSSLFADPTQGSRLPDVGIDIHKLKEAVERNDKMYLLDVGELLRERVGMHSREAQAERTMKEAQRNSKDKEDKNGGSGGSGGSKGPSPMINMVEITQKPDTTTSHQEPIFGSLTAKAEKELLEKIHTSGQSLETGGLGMLGTPRDSSKAQEDGISNKDGTGRAPYTKYDDMLHVFREAGKVDPIAGGSNNNTSTVQSTETSQPGAGSSTGTPVDFAEYLHSDFLNSASSNNNHSNILGGFDFNQFLFPNGPSPPGFQLPDFTGLPSHMSSFNNSSAAYQSSNNFNSHHGSNFLQPQMQHGGAPSPAFGMPSSSSTPLPKQSPTEGQAILNGPSSFTSNPSASLAGHGALQLPALKEASKTLHKQAKQLIKFHLRSKQEDSTHEMPAALEATAAQAIMPHDQRIDSVLWPAMRDRLIFAGGKIDLEVVLQSLESGEAVVVHATGDLMDPAAWEVSEAFVHAHPGLMDGEVLKVCNKWRAARGEAQIAL